ncbi:hypothetical protein [Limnobacter sp.]|uniref:hypothetical protein n=1 Tax=Limnobacter sp. TaxID=2003368 RepID=UPI0025C5A2D5|nr:hypothetical protein [Limnobacter sp.]
MAGVDPNQSVQWQPTTIAGEVDTAEEAVQAWLNQNPGVNLADMSKSELTRLINFLQSQSSQPWAQGSDLNALITDLKQIRNSWDSSTGTDPLNQLDSELKSELALLRVLAEHTQGTDALDTAIAELQPQADAVAEVMSAISTSTSSWSAENNIKTVDQVNELLAKLDTLEASGVNLNSVGLGTLKTELITAKAAYESSIAADPSAENQQLALSQFRESVAKAKMNYLLSTGLSTSDPKVQAEQKVMRSEDLWQYNLETDWDVSEIPGPEGYSEKELQSYLDELKLQYSFAVDRGDTNAQRYISTKMSQIEGALNSLVEGNDGFGVSINLFLDLKGTDIAEKTRLRDEAFKNGDQALVDQLDQEIESISKLVEAVMSEFSAIMSKLAEVASQAYQSAF